MSLYEDWMKKAFSQEGRSIEAVWEEYLPKEQKIYEYILGEKVTKLDCRAGCTFRYDSRNDCCIYRRSERISGRTL